MPGYPSEPIAAQIAGPEMIGPFGAASLAINQAAVALKLGVNDATTGSNLNIGVPMPYAGSIVGMIQQFNTNVTHVTVGASPTINTTEIGSTIPLYRVQVAVSTAKTISKVDGNTQGLRFLAGDVLGVKVTTDAAFTPAASADYLVWLLVMFEQVQP